MAEKEREGGHSAMENSEGGFKQTIPEGDSIAPTLLVSLPSLNDPYFRKSVILLCDYSQDHAYGMVINRPSALMVKDILADASGFKRKLEGPLLVGGPVSPEFLWALHSAEFTDASTTQVGGAVAMSSVQEVLKSISEGQGPHRYLMGSGYAGWGPGQLDREIQEGAWWTAPVDAKLVLNLPYEQRWEAVINELGIDPQTMSFFTTGEA